MTESIQDPNQLTTPLDNIALTFSGGGFRAAAFSLGALSYLDQLKIAKTGQSQNDLNLLNNVSYISSTSGGSFTNALYSSYIHKGKTFEDVYNKLTNDMAGQNLLQQVFAILDDDTQWDQPGNGKHRNIINAFAKAYDKVLFEGETFGIFWNKEHVPQFEVCFNSTEFYRGLSFRFQTEGDNNLKQITGNNYLHFNTQQIDTIKKLKLADMVAASSCFPAGFEPIVYPHDFSYSQDEKKLTIEELQKALLFENYQEEISSISKPYGFMDGGITDNQGLYSAMLADKKRRRRKEADPFDLIMVTDVTSYFMDDYDVPTEKNKPAWRTRNINYYLNKIKTGIKTFSKAINWSCILFLILLLAGIATIVFSANGTLTIVASFVCGVSVVVLLLIYLVKTFALVKWALKNKVNIEQDGFINNMAKEQKFFSEKLMIRFIHFLRVTRIGLLEQMIKARIASLLSMLLDVNLKQTRRLIYEMFYNEPMWDNRRIPNFIYELSTYNITSRTNRFNNQNRLKWVATNEDKILFLSNCEKLNKVAEEARTMGTTLWFDKNDVEKQKLKKIIAAGQFTTCCNLLEYLISLERKGTQFEENISKQLAEIKTKLTEDFIHFKADPFYLFNRLGK